VQNLDGSEFQGRYLKIKHRGDKGSDKGDIWKTAPVPASSAVNQTEAAGKGKGTGKSAGKDLSDMFKQLTGKGPKPDLSGTSLSNLAEMLGKGSGGL